MRVFVRKNILLILACVLPFLLFLYLAYSVTSISWVHRLDLEVQGYFASTLGPAMDRFMIFVTSLIDVRNLSLLLVALMALLFLRNRGRRALILASAVVFGGVTSVLIKQLIRRVRPENGIILAQGASFPSGHTLLATLFFGMLFYAFREDFQTRAYRYLFGTFCVLGVVLVSFSRIYLGVHWLSDVIAGMSLGICGMSVFFLGVRLLKTFYPDTALRLQSTFRFSHEEA